MNSQSNGKTIYCHFSFKRPKGTNYGLFAVAFYSDFAGKHCLIHKTTKYDLWQDHQFITAIQSYENALKTIYEYQGQMIEANVTDVMLVTDNSTLAGWIENPKKNKVYYPWMERAVKLYRSTGPKKIEIGIGLCDVREAEKSYKYCKEELVENNYVAKDTPKPAVYRMPIDENNYKSILDIIKDDKSVPEISGINQL